METTVGECKSLFKLSVSFFFEVLLCKQIQFSSQPALDYVRFSVAGDYRQKRLNARDSVRISSSHRILDLQSETPSEQVRWIREECPIDCGQCELGTTLRQQHLAGAHANNAVFREPRQTE